MIVAMKKDKKSAGARIRIVLGPDIAIGPGKAAILEEVKAAGSISAAGRSMGMGYKRAWYMIDTMNKCFNEPLVITVKGGKQGGGARLTELGEEVLKRYRKMEELSAKAIEKDLASLKKMLDLK
jgi:molybdate transport system regulatory protein